MILEEGVKRINNDDELDTDCLKHALKRISTYKGYKVDLHAKDKFKIFGHAYGGGKDKTIIIKENGKCLFVIYKDRENDEMRLVFHRLI